MRIKDLNILTMNEITNTLDPRIQGIHIPASDRWALRIQETTVDDSGDYECQVTTPTKTIAIVKLNVLGEFVIRNSACLVFRDQEYSENS